MNGFNSEIKQELYRDAILTYGRDAQIDVAIEEMAELTKALIKNRREDGKSGNHEAWQQAYDNVAEEIVDVQIMLDQLKIIYEYNSNIEFAKLNRLQNRLSFRKEDRSHAET